MHPVRSSYLKVHPGPVVAFLGRHVLPRWIEDVVDGSLVVRLCRVLSRADLEDQQTAISQ